MDVRINAVFELFSLFVGAASRGPRLMSGPFDDTDGGWKPEQSRAPRSCIWSRIHSTIGVLTD